MKIRLAVSVLPAAVVMLLSARAFGQWVEPGGRVTQAAFETPAAAPDWVTPIAYGPSAYGPSAYPPSPYSAPPRFAFGGHSGEMIVTPPPTFPMTPPPMSGPGMSTVGPGYGGPGCPPGGYGVNGVTPHDVGLPHPLGPYRRERTPRWYVGLMGGVNGMDGHSIVGVEPGLPAPREFEIQTDFDTGYGVGAFVGYIFDTRFPFWYDRLRVELEFSYRENEIESLRLNGLHFDPRTEAQLYGGILNFIFDAKPWFFGVRPYVGLGLGGGRASLEISKAGNPNVFPGRFAIDDGDGVLIWQGILGASVEVWQDVEFFMDFRYTGTSDPEYGAEILRRDPTPDFDFPAPVPLQFASTGAESSGFDNYSLFFGVRWLLGRHTHVIVRPPSTTGGFSFGSY